MVNPDEPLVHRPENYRRLAPPTMRIAVVIILLVQQRLVQAQFVQYGFVRIAFPVFLQNGFTNHLDWHLLGSGQIVGVGESSIIIHRRINGQAVRAPQVVIVQTVPGCDMHKSGSGGIVHERITREKFPGALAEWVLIFELGKMSAIQAAHDFIILPPTFFGDCREQHRRNNVLFFSHPHE